MQALQLTLGLGFVALEALLGELAVADLLFQPRPLLAQQGALVVVFVYVLLLCLLGLLQGVGGFGQFLRLGGELVLLAFVLLMGGGGAVGGGQGLLPLHIVEQVLLGGQFVFKAAVALGGFGLALQLFYLAVELALQVGQPLQVFAGVFEAGFGFAAALFVFGYARGFFDIGAQFFRARFDDARNHALLNHGIAARAHAGAEEKVGDVAAAHGLVVDVVAGFALAGELALNRHFGVLPPCALQGAAVVVEHQLHGGAGGGAAGGGAVENHVLHAFAAQLLGRGFAQHPAHGVDDIAFAAAVGADHGHQLAGHADGGGVDKGFETGKFDVG